MKPQLAESAIIETLQRILAADTGIVSLDDLRETCPIMAFSVRGYYQDTMGEPGQNDFGIFDDACFLVDLREDEGKRIIGRYRWNTDPSRSGHNPGVGKGYAILQPGVWPVYRGMHKQKYQAWRQHGHGTDQQSMARQKELGRFFSDFRKHGWFRIWRGQIGQADQWGYQAINIHPGGIENTSSWGCQTAPNTEDQWQDFLKMSYSLTRETGQPVLPYVLTAEKLS